MDWSSYFAVWVMKGSGTSNCCAGKKWLDEESESSSVMSNSLWPHGLYSPWNSPGQNSGVGSLSFHQGIFPSQWSNPGLPHSRWILYQLSHKGSPRILEWVADPFSSRWGELPWICRGRQVSSQTWKVLWSQIPLSLGGKYPFEN